MSGDEMAPVGASATGVALLLASTGASVLWVGLAAAVLMVGGALLVRLGMHRSRRDRPGA